MLHRTPALRASTRALACLVATGVAGCDCGTATITDVYPEIRVTPASLAFGPVGVGTTAELPLDVSNVGRGPLFIGPVSVADIDDITVPAGQILVKNCAADPRHATNKMELTLGDCGQIVVQFQPMSVESLSTYIIIPSNDATHDPVKVPVTGSGVIVPLPQIQVCVLDATGMVDPSQCTDFTTTPPTIPTIAFGTVGQGMSVGQTLRIFDKGNGNLSVSSVKVQATSTDVSLTSPPPFPVTVPPGGSGDIVVTLDSRGTGSITGNVVISSDDPAHMQVDIPITADEQATAPPIITFTAPPITQTTPPVAVVTGRSPVAVSVASVAPLQTVVITFDANMPLASWTTPASSMTQFSQPVTWIAQLGIGTHTLNAVATDTNNRSAMATRAIKVECASDSDCPANDRCCATDGTCNPIVAEGADCDCDHPCPTNQGCFPGTCGQTPQQCRPGCNPGSDTVAAADCTMPQNGEPAWCSPLPSGQATNQNMGGACAPGDSCSITSQNCPEFPLDRSQPASASNPMVKYTCVPAAPGPPQINECMPAGTIPVGGTGCTYTCGNDTTNCARGAECVQLVDECFPGEPGCMCAADGTCFANDGPPLCMSQCNDPNGSCNNGDACGELLGNGFVSFQTGVCDPDSIPS